VVQGQGIGRYTVRRAGQAARLTHRQTLTRS
jgi:hypothetical protein